HSFLTTSVRGSGRSPTTSASTGDGVIAFMKAAFGLRLAPVDFFAPFFVFLAIRSPPRGDMKFPASLRKAGGALYQSGRGKNSVSINFFIRVLPVKMASDLAAADLMAAKEVRCALW